MSGPSIDAGNEYSSSFRNQRDRRKSCSTSERRNSGSDRWLKVAYPINGGTVRSNSLPVVVECAHPAPVAENGASAGEVAYAAAALSGSSTNAGCGKDGFLHSPRSVLQSLLRSPC